MKQEYEQQQTSISEQNAKLVQGNQVQEQMKQEVHKAKQEQEQLRQQLLQFKQQNEQGKATTRSKQNNKTKLSSS